MYRYRCPDCGGRLSLNRLYDGRYLCRCVKCSLAHIAKPMLDSEDEAYLKMLEDYDRGALKKLSVTSLLEREGILRSKRNVEEMVDREGVRLEDLPNPVNHTLFSETDYPVLYRLIPEEEPKPGGSPAQQPIDEALAKTLIEAGIEKLYRFQEEAVEAVLRGENVAIVAPTGSGKTEAFTVPILQLISKGYSRFGGLRLGRGAVKALFIYPTKALARDQLPKLRRLADSVGVRVEVFDGDTPVSDRRRIIEDPPDIVVTNFDTLHHHFIHRTLFSRLIRTVKYVVVDEVHVYTGTFGSNVHFILRRLQRLCGGFQAVAASATISNPKEFCEQLFGRGFTVVEGGEGRHGKIHFAMIFPTMRRHLALTVDMLKHLTESGWRTLTFSGSHLSAELTAFYARRSGVDIEVHRAGLPPSWRKSVEERFKRGELKAISSTPTLELGIDIGSVDSIVSDLVNWTRLIQRTGRAGRRGQESIVLLSLRDSDPISQYYKNNPEDYFRDVEPGYVDPSNPVVARFQILSASIDRPIEKGEFAELQPIIDELIEAGLLYEKGGGLIPDYSAARRVLMGYDIRGAGDAVSITLQNRRIGERGMPQALDELHPESVYFLGGARYRSKSFTLHRGGGRAEVERLPGNYPYYTRPLKEEWPLIQKIYLKKRAVNVEAAYCDLSILKKVIGYVNIEIGSDSSKGLKVQLPEPLEYSFYTKGIVFKAPNPDRLLTSAFKRDPTILAASSFHAAEHVTIEGTNMITGGAASDMGGVSLGHSGLIFIYDGSRGGNGATRLLYDRLEEAFKRASRIVKECTCTSEDGCPRCTYSYRCGNNNDYLNRGGAIEVFERILAGEETSIDVEVSPDNRPFV